MVQYHARVLFLALVICASLWKPGYLAQDETTSEGTCNAYDPRECSAHTSSCQDGHPKCLQWAQVGECDNNPGYMLNNCRRSCLQCPDQADELARHLAEKKKPERIWSSAELEVAADMGVKQNLVNDNFKITEEQSSARIIAARQNIQNGGFDNELLEICKNEHEDCTTWAVAGECEKNKKYMLVSCAPACLTCHMKRLENRCPIDPNAKAAWEPGDLNAMFEYLTTFPIASKYPVTIHSRDPWVVTLDDVVSEEEAKRLIELGGLLGYERSEDVGRKNADGSYGSVVSTGRTSTNAWCVDDCYDDPMAQDVIARLSELTMINERNSEYLQLLRYEPDQFYEVSRLWMNFFHTSFRRNRILSSLFFSFQDHHDYIGHNINNQQGVRILTSYLYLNDVEAGGGTKFGSLNITVMPKRGRALFWPSVLNDAPHTKDHRTNHEGTLRNSSLDHNLHFACLISNCFFILLQRCRSKLESSMEPMVGFINMISRLPTKMDVRVKAAIKDNL